MYKSTVFLKYMNSLSDLQVRQLCISLLASHPAQDFVLIALHTLTKLATAALLGTVSQVRIDLD